jgi:hydrogenase expression/formation protein HypC
MMCLGVPGKVTELYDAGGLRMAKVDFGSLIREACLEYIPEVEVGNYVIIHVGFAISRLNEDEALSNLALLQEIQDSERADNMGPPHRPEWLQPA